jgi:Icc protein
MAGQDLMPSGHPQHGAYRILQLTDLHLRDPSERTLLGVDTEESFLQTLACARQDGAPPDLLLLTGDLAEDPSPHCYQRLQALLQRLPFPSLCIPGNHDDPKIMAQHLMSDEKGIVSHYQLGPWKLVGINSARPDLPSGLICQDELIRLRLIIDQAQEPYILIALHHHPVESGSPWMDRMRLMNSKDLLNLVTESPKVRGLVFGHIHQEMDLLWGAIRLLGTPSTCVQFAPGADVFKLDQKPTGYRWLILNDQGNIDSIVVRAIDLDDQICLAERQESANR